MRNMSFALTTAQMQARTKTVTRRMGWERLKSGELVRPVYKAMGLKRGESPQPICDPVRVILVRREPLHALLDDLDYGFAEVAKEGFANHPQYQWPSAFVEFFCGTHRGCTPQTLVTRIEFEFVAALA